MSILVPHLYRPATRHSVIPWLWRVGCSCGWYALAGTEHLARQAFAAHQYEEEPFPSDEVFDINKDHPDERKD
jgi:hypothetical protein